MPRFKTFTAALLSGGRRRGLGPKYRPLDHRHPDALGPDRVAVAEVGGKIYLVGGFGGERELEVYDPASDRWSRGASIPRPLHHAAAVGLKDKLYVVGGFVEGWTPTLGDDLEWDEHPPWSRRGAAASAASADSWPEIS